MQIFTEYQLKEMEISDLLMLYKEVCMNLGNTKRLTSNEIDICEANADLLEKVLKEKVLSLQLDIEELSKKILAENKTIQDRDSEEINSIAWYGTGYIPNF